MPSTSASSSPSTARARSLRRASPCWASAPTANSPSAHATSHRNMFPSERIDDPPRPQRLPRRAAGQKHARWGAQRSGRTEGIRARADGCRRPARRERGRGRVLGSVRPMGRLWRSLLAALALAAAASPQEELGWRTAEPLRLVAWRDPLARASSSSELALGAPVTRPSVPGRAWFKADARAEELAALLVEVPPPVLREELGDSGEELLRYRALPGGIVLGRVGRGASELAGARL